MTSWWKDPMRRKTWIFTALLILVPAPVAVGAGPQDVGKILQLSLQATRADWQRPANMLQVERDADPHDGKSSTKTYRVIMMDGSPYEELIARDGQALPPDEVTEQNDLLQAECAKRANQSADERARRVAKYQRNQQRMFDLLREMVNAFDFTLTGESQVENHRVYELRATPRQGYQPPNREAKMLTGMQGTLWIDEASYRWARVEAEVTRPVWFGWFLAKVYPGTRFLLDQAPVAGDVWMPTHFRVNVKSIVLLFHKDITHDETFRDYHLLPAPAKSTAAAERN